MVDRKLYCFSKNEKKEFFSFVFIFQTLIIDINHIRLYITHFLFVCQAKATSIYLFYFLVGHVEVILTK